MTESTLERQSDSEERWGPLQRHQLVLVALASTFVVCWLFVSGLSTALLLLAIGCVVAACPMGRGLTIAQWVLTAVRFAVRSHWTTIDVVLEGGRLSLGRGTLTSGTLSTLHHVGRLDLSGYDAVLAGQLRDVVGALSATTAGGHVAHHITMTRGGARTQLSAPVGGDLAGWTPSDVVPLLGTVRGGRLLREGWRELRSIDGVYCVGRIETFRPNGELPLLEALQRTGTPSTLAVHCAVVPSSRAPRIVGRAVHRRGVDETATRALGFRRSAQADRVLTRLAHREAAVAAGHALVRVAVYLVVQGETVAEVRAGVRRVTTLANDDGTRVRWGTGRQTQWFLWALPGGGQW